MESLISAGQACLEVAEVKKLDHSKDKWVKYYLSNEELNLLNRLNKSSKITNATDLYDVNVGLVSGENAFFVINQEIVDKFHLQESVVPIISRTDQIKGLELTEQDYENLVKAGKKVYFFEPTDLPIDELPKFQRKYIQWGEAQEYNKNYKCRIRPRWYHVSYTWRAEAFLVRQGRKYGVGLVVISQRPSEVNRTVLSQSNNFIAMRLTNADDQAVVKRLLPDSLGDYAEMLPILDIGEALIVGDASLLPSRIRIAPPKLKPRSATIDFWDEWAKETSAVNIRNAIEALRKQSK